MGKAEHESRADDGIAEKYNRPPTTRVGDDE